MPDQNQIARDYGTDFNPNGPWGSAANDRAQWARINQTGGNTGAPLSLAPPPAAVAANDPGTGAGWKQGIQNVVGAAQKTLGGMQFGADGHLGSRTAAPGAAAAQKLASPTPLQGPGPQGPTLQQRAQTLLQQGAISQDQYNNIMRSLGGAPPSTGMAEMASSPPTGGTPPPQQPQAYQPPAPPLGPTSQGWGG